jgi:RNA ligase (TIGR02306 family)
MSFFAVTIEEIAELKPHPNADRLLIASLKGIGFQFIVPKGNVTQKQWEVGDRCLYFPLDSIVPEPILVEMNLVGKLSGGQKNRVKTIKLRGSISQGLVAPLSLIDGLPEAERTPENITAFLGVKKYEPEIDLPFSYDARLVPLPDGVGIYDVENAERYPLTVSKLMKMPVWITEKLEGTHFAVAYINQKLFICQRRFALEPIEDKPEHLFWEVAKALKIPELIENLYKKYKADHMVLRGELIGPNVQTNIYHLSQRTIRFFDLQVNHRYIGSGELKESFEALGAAALLAPFLCEGKTLEQFLAGRSLAEAATGNSMLHTTLREGIIIRPDVEQAEPEELRGRLIIKQISPEYLAGAN